MLVDLPAIAITVHTVVLPPLQLFTDDRLAGGLDSSVKWLRRVSIDQIF